jgi:hypothetical protein
MAQDGAMLPSVSLRCAGRPECWRSRSGLWLIVFTAPNDDDAKEEE